MHKSERVGMARGGDNERDTGEAAGEVGENLTDR